MKLGIIGTGTIVEEVLGFIHKFDFEKIYICGRKKSQERVEFLAKQFNLDAIYYEYEQILKSDADVIYIGLPNDMHYDYSKQAIEAGKHVIVEKPATVTYEQLVELDSLAKQNHVIFIEAMSIYHMPAYKALQQDIKKIGDIRVVNLNYSQLSKKYKRFCEGDITPVFDKDRNGGALRDINIYNISAMVGLFGKPNSVFYEPNIIKGVDVSGIALAKYDTFVVNLIGAKDCNSSGPSTFQGEAATINVSPFVNGMTSYDIIYNDSSISSESVNLDTGCNRLEFEFVEFIRILNQNDQAACDLLMQKTKLVSQIIDKCLC